ncbi:MAG: hypothetical protein ACR2FG_00425 [Marmoricola sp.]
MTDHAPDGPLLDMVQSAQRAAGVLAARERGDVEGAADLMASFVDADDLAGGSLMLARLTLGLYAECVGLSIEECVRELSLQLEDSLR